MTRTSFAIVGSVSVSLIVLPNLQCASGIDEESTAKIEAALTSAAAADPVPCAAWADAVVANTSNVIIGAGTLIDSYQSSLGAYGGTNVGSAAVVQAATTISNNGGVIHGTQKPHAPAGFAVVPVPAGARNLPLGSRTPGALNIGTRCAEHRARPRKLRRRQRQRFRARARSTSRRPARSASG